MKINNIQLQKYTAYKDSGVEWLGEIPEHWEVNRIKFLFKIGRGRVISQQELIENGKYPVYSSQTLDNGVLGYIDTFDFDCTQITWTTDGANAGTVFLRDGKHNCTNVCGTLQPINNEQIIEFIKYTLQVAAQFYKRPDTNGAKIMNGEMGEIFITLPSKKEQTAIANFLDNKTAQIESAIAIKQKQIELLKERRQIVIHRAVTRGIGSLSGAETPDVKLKDSGVEWIGEIPEHWEVKRLKYLAKNIISGPFGSALIKDEYVKEGYKIYGQEQVIPNDFSIGDYYITESKFKRMLRYEIFKDDILISCVGTYGKIALVPEIFQKGIINPRLIKITPLYDYIIPRYLQEILLSPFCFSQFEQVSRGGTMGVINIELLSQLIIIIPTIEEQEAILSFLQEGKLRIDSAITLKNMEIEKLKEYKSVLINEAVSGKIKVG